MSWWPKSLSRGHRYEDLSVSIREHIAERADELMGEGMSRAHAEQMARREFGNVTFFEERSREAWQWPTVESILADVRFALRQLIKSPGFTLTAVLTLALGIAVNATMFSLVSAFLMPHLPGRDPNSAVVVSSVNPDAAFLPDTNPSSAANWLEWRKDKRIFSDAAASNEYQSGSLAEPGQQPEAVSYATVSANYFSIFGVSPQLGRTFVAGEDQAGHNHVLILSYGVWRRRFNGDPGVVGRTVRLNREDYVVAGVMPQDFRQLGFTPQLWTPLTLTAADFAPDARKNRFLLVFARLAPGVTTAQAKAQVDVLAQEMQKDFPETENRWGANVRTLQDFLIHNFGIGTALTVIMTVVAFVLLIVCANVAGLLLTRAVGRQKELAIRMSLGASRVRVVRQLLTEGLVIALAGGGLGLLLTYFGIQAVHAGLSFNEAISVVPVSLDSHVLIFTAVVSLASAVLSSVAPALKASYAAINTDLKSETRGATSGRAHNRLRVVLVGGQIALAMFLLIGSCLLIRAVYLLDHQKLGFDHGHLLTAGVVLDQKRYADAAKQNEFVRQLVERLKQVPGAEAAAVASNLPASGPAQLPVQIKGQTESRANEQHTSADMVVTPEYFRAIGVPILRGRGVTAQDDAGAARAVVVSQQFVRRYFKDQDPMGKQIRMQIPGAPTVWSQVVGVAGDVKTYSEDPATQPLVYEAFAQRPVSGFSLMVRSNVDPDRLADALRHVVSQLDPELPLLRVMSMDGVIDEQRNGNPLFEKLLATFAILALSLSAIGIYGLIAYSVGQRTHEIGIRLALGASAADISRMVLREGLKVAAIGSAIGFVLAIPLPKLFESIFQGLLVGSVSVYPIVLAVMLIIALGATFGPALRATRVDATAALRNE